MIREEQEGGSRIDNLFTSQGEMVAVAGNQRLLLDDPDALYLVRQGPVFISAVPLVGGEIAGTRRFLCEIPAGELICGMDLAGRSIALLATGSPGSGLLRLSRADLAGGVLEQADLSELIDCWIERLAATLTRSQAPVEYFQLKPAESPPDPDFVETLEPVDDPDLVEVGQGTAVRPREGVVWARLSSGEATYFGDDELPVGVGDGFLPLTANSWLICPAQPDLQALNSEELLAQGDFWTSLAAFHQRALQALLLYAARDETAERVRLQEKRAAGSAQVEKALAHLAGAIEPQPPAAELLAAAQMPGHDSLPAVCALVGAPLGLRIQIPPQSASGRMTLEGIAAASQFRTRQVLLRGRWWHEDNGPLLGFLEEAERPVALLAEKPGHYQVIDPRAAAPQMVTEALARRLQPIAYSFYPRLPAAQVGALDLLKMGFRHQRRDMVTILLAGTAVGLMGTVVPIAIGTIFDFIIPAQQRSLMVSLALVLVILALASAAFGLAQSYALLRIDGHAGMSLQAAVWDRLLRLPIAFHKRYTAGDLADRALGVDSIRLMVTDLTVTTILTGIFSVFYFLLIFYYDSRLALLALLLISLPGIVTLIYARSLVNYEREVSALRGGLAGLVFQIVSGIAKLRVAGAEGRAFAIWGRQYAALKRAVFRSRTVAKNLTVINVTYPTLATIVVFAAAVNRGESLSTGQFLAFFSAFSLLLMAALGLNNGILTVVTLIPLYERFQPILAAEPEVDLSKAEPGELSGDIEVSNVSFRYQEDGPLILKDISIKIRPGDFVAIVGPSGSGKSTLFRLLMGFERPEKGTIYYNGQNLDGLDIREVRRQIGMVLQQSQVSPVPIFENIIGGSGSHLTIDDAWQAAELAGLAEDIRQMPMGMHTLISEGGTTLSGGQRQRLLIARAIVNKPRVLYFDEATSALDNRTQSVVSQSLEQLEATRLVIAHRLSTIRHADQIFVLKRGELVQSGTYEALVAVPGLFQDLARRQLVE